ncbi:MAG TPA: IclR family transcriptional regulator [Castellaniella sp.]|jgi:DNA-binding IclR family transcriptional regulator|nr:IclR family transcriptional regulator [Castellaniella sp.]
MTLPDRGPSLRARPAGTAAFSKFVHLLQLVAESDRPCSVAELVRLSGYPRATVYRTVAGLVAERLLAASLADKTYVLGPRLIEFASRSWEQSELRRLAVVDLAALRDATGETVHLAVPDDRKMVYIEKLESPSAVRMASRIGSSVSMHSSAVGKAYLARLNEATCEQILERLEFPRYTANTVDSAEALREQLHGIRARGWAQDEEENEEGIFCFGAAIVDVTGRPVAAVSVSTLRFRQRPDPLQAYVAPLRAACDAISRQIARVPAAYRTVS